MTASFPAEIRAPRWFFTMPAVLALPVIGFGGMLMSTAVHRHWTDTGLLLFGTLIALGGGAWLLNSLLNICRPPCLRLDEDSLRYTTVYRTRQWPWRRIILSMLGGRSSGVSFSSIEDGKDGSVMRQVFLDKAFLGLSGDPKPLYDRLVAAQNGAKAIPRAAATPIAPFAPAFRRREPNPIWRSRIFQFLVFLFIGAHVVALFDFILAGTQLLAPTNGIFITAAEWVAAAISLGVFALAFPFRFPFRATVFPTSRALPLPILLALSCPALSALAYGHIAWRIEELTTFAGSTAPFQRYMMRVQRVNMAKGNADAWADGPAGDTFFLPISGRDYRRFPTDYLDDYDACYPIYVQHVGRAVRMLKPGRPAADELRIVDCKPR